MIGDNTLPALAAEIRAAHARVKMSTLMAAEQAVEAGRLLIEARALVAHGGWADWLARHVGFSDRSARRYMQLARAGFNSATVAEFGLRATAEALAEGSGPLPIPDPEIEVFASRVMNYREPFAAIREISPGWFGVAYLADDEIVTSIKPVAHDGLDSFLLITSSGRLSRLSWRWRRSEHDTFGFLNEIATINAARGKSAAFERAKQLARETIDSAEAAVHALEARQ